MKNFIKEVWQWFETEGREHLPWRMTRDPYAICVSECMLQQTQVERVIPKYHEWLTLFPNWQCLASASPAEVLRSWSGLGYNSRALRLQKLAQSIVADHHGQLPMSTDELLALPGIGPYTAAALQSFAFEQEVVVVDTNIERILLRYFWAVPHLDRGQIEKKLVALLACDTAKQHHPFSRYFFQALMDLGAKVCRGIPHCESCPLRKKCKAYASQSFLVKRPKQSHFPHSRRFYRGMVLKLLRTREHISVQELEAVDIQGHMWSDIIETLQKDALITVHQGVEAYITLPGAKS